MDPFSRRPAERFGLDRAQFSIHVKPIYFQSAPRQILLSSAKLHPEKARIHLGSFRSG